MFARDAEVTRIFRLSTGGTSVELIGPRWSGRSAVLKRVHELYDRAGATTVFVRGVGDRLPIEAVRVALPATASGNQPPASPSALVARFAALKPAVILIDDGEELDDASWAVIETVHKSVGTTIISARVERPALSRNDHLLIRFAHPVVRVTLAPLDLEVMHEILEERLGGAIAPSLSGRIHTKSAGIPGFALAIVDSAESSGQIRRQGSVWVDGPDLWGPDLNGSYEALLHTFDEDVREGAEMLSLTGTVDLPTAQSLLGQPMIEKLEQNALLQVFATQRGALVAISPPGLGDYFRHLPLSARRLRIIDAITTALAQHHPAATDSVQLYLKNLPEMSATGKRATLDLPLVSRMFSETHNVESAAALHAWLSESTVGHAIRVLSLQLTGPADPRVVEQVLKETNLAGADGREELTFRYLRSRWMLTQSAAADVISGAVLDGMREGFEYADALVALAYAVRMEADRIPNDYEQRLSGLAAVAGTNGDIARLILAYGHILSARANEALVLLEQRPVDSSLLLGGQYDVAQGLALYASGRLSEAAAWSSSRIESCIADVERTALAGHTAVCVLALASLGRFDEAMDAARIVLSASISAASLLFAPDRATLIALVMVGIRMGRTMTAEGLLERADTLLGRCEGLPFGHRGLTVAVATSATGDHAHGAAQYLSTARALSDRGYVLGAQMATMLSLIADFDPELALTFRDQAQAIGGPLYGAYLDGRDASLREDPDGLTAAARVLRRQHAGDEALRFFTQAINLYRDRGDEVMSARVREEVRSLLADEDSMSAWVSSRSATTVGLTAREAEIVSMVSAGLGNAEIAEGLKISIRTVETHLRNIKKKTGAGERGDIVNFGADISAR